MYLASRVVSVPWELVPAVSVEGNGSPKLLSLALFVGQSFFVIEMIIGKVAVTENRGTLR